MLQAVNPILERLKKKMPFTAAMGVDLLEYEPDSVTLWAPLRQNLNYHETVFGGSIATLGILAGWMLLNLQLNGDQDDCANSPYHIVIQESRTEYLSPIQSDFQANCRLPEADAWQRFKTMLERRGKGRITLCSELGTPGCVAARETGVYVACLKGR